MIFHQVAISPLMVCQLSFMLLGKTVFEGLEEHPGVFVEHRLGFSIDRSLFLDPGNGLSTGIVSADGVAGCSAPGFQFCNLVNQIGCIVDVDYYFSKKFKQEVGITLAEYIRSKRLERAAMLLQSTNEDVQAIAMRLQFCSQSYFTDSFRKKYGISPSKYRKNGMQSDAPTILREGMTVKI